MAEVNRCPQCGCNTPPDSPADLCPHCLFAAGLEPPAPSAAVRPLNDAARTEARPTTGFVPPKPDEIADLFPQFEILDLLGHGGMGAVYKARQKSLDRLVALKIIKPGAVDDRGFAERFDREAKALAKLSHSNIVSVHDSGTSEGLYYFVMEYVDGTNLRQLIVEKSLAPNQAIQIIPQICEALQFAHDAGIVHRDIKPENILIDSRGRVKIADFGLAKLLDSPRVEDHTLTATHQVMGTPRYMAPEQMVGAKRVDHRADIYSLGVVFYEMLTGELPMGHFEPPSRKATVDARLDEVVLRSLAREPERRYQHASDVRTDLESIQSQMKAGTAPVAPRRMAADNNPPQARFSRKAIIGACWIPLFFLALFMTIAPLVTIQVSDGDQRPQWTPLQYAMLALLPLAFLGLAAPFGTTILGLIAISDIRSSQGQLRGLGLAFLDAIFFPLIVFDAVVWVGVLLVARLVEPDAAGMPIWLLLIFFLIATLLTNIPLVIWLWHRAARADRAVDESGAERSPLNWAHLMQGLLVVGSTLALIGFALWYAQTAWVLAGLALPAFGVCFAFAYCEERPDEALNAKAAGLVLLATFVSTLAMIGLGVAIENSAWPLLGIVPVLIGGVLGIGAGTSITEQDAGESSATDETEASAAAGEPAGGADPAMSGKKRDDDWDDDDDEGWDDEPEESPQEKLESAAWCIGLVGLFRSWVLLSSGSKWFEQLIEGATTWPSFEMWVRLTGPVIVLAALSMYRGRLYWLAVTGSLLCLATGNCLPVILGAYALVALFDPQIRALFKVELGFATGDPDSHQTVADGSQRPVKSPLPQGYGAQLGSTLGSAWTEWWRERDALFTRGVQIVIMVLHLACLLAFLGFTSIMTATPAGNPQFRHSIGLPAPWFSLEATTAGGDLAFNHQPHWTTSAWAIAAIGLCLAYIYCRIEKVRSPRPSLWNKPEIFLLVWGLLALADVAVGVGLGYQALRSLPSVAESKSSILATRDAGSAKQHAAAAVGQHKATADDPSAPAEAPSTSQLDPQTSALLEAVGAGDAKRVVELVASGADPNASDAEGQTALMRAAARGDWEMCLALGAGADFHLRDTAGRTALWHAIENRRTAFLTSRLRAAQDNLAQWSPTSVQQDRLVAADTLALVGDSGRTPLQLADALGMAELAADIRRYLNSLIDATTRRIAGELGSAGAHYRQRALAQRALGQSAEANLDLREATRFAGVQNVSRLRSAAMLEACRIGDASRVNELLEAGAGVNEKDVAGRTALMRAIAGGHRSLALTLVVLGADLTEQDEQGQTAMMTAVQVGDGVLITRLRELQQVSSESDAGTRQAKLRAFSGVERSLLKGSDIDLRNLELSVLELQADQEGRTAAMHAVEAGDWDLFSLVATTTASVRARDGQGRTYAMAAAIHGHRAWFERLDGPRSNNGAERGSFVGPMQIFDVDQLALTDMDDKTALQLAEEHGSPQIGQMLRRYLEAVVEQQTQRLDAADGDREKHLEVRRQARRALGQPDDPS